MTDAEKLRRDIDTLRESIREQWLELAIKPLTRNDREAIRRGINTCVDDLTKLLKDLDDI